MAKQSNKPKTTTQNTAKTYETPPAKSQTTGRAAGSQSTTQNMGRTAERRKEREREKRRQQLITGGIIVVALVAIAAFVFFIVNTPAEAPIPAAALTRYEGVPVSQTTQGYPVLGDPNAPVQVVEYSSFDCPHCREFHDTAISRIVDRVKQGNVAFTYVPLYGYGSFVNGQGAASAAICAAEQDKFWPFHDALFDWQGQFGNQAFTNNRISSGVDAFQLDRGAYNACIASSRPGEVLTAASSQARGLLNFSGTPTIAINGVVVLDATNQATSDVDTIMARIESEVARFGSTTPPTTQPTAQSAPTSVATTEVTDAPAAPTEEAVASTVPTEEATAETTPAS